ncbi:hypothetical protein [Sphingomonas sp. 35-24ZXX]|uniref:hypothetical protein n=1 Tax=Sphingomonas sp. 35-24ZXX TaxID=1545915 RepID=UPI000689233A|nr:hypothetical protein [Sphingomonas sp. 35-24ZXX]
MVDANENNARIPGVSDREVRRYRIFSFDFDSTPRDLTETPGEDWSEEAKLEWQQRREQSIAWIARDYGERNLDQKVADFAAFDAKPFSIVAHHNVMFDHVRAAFVSGGYYAALTGACALGERILNHLMLDLRDHYKATPQYKHVYRKDSFDRWSLVIDTLAAWNVLLPEVVDAFRELETLRNRSIHFNAETATQLRVDALSAAGLLSQIIEKQFCAFGLQPWFIEGTLGAGFIKREWELDPFVAHYYCAKNVCVGPFHSVDFHPSDGWRFVDHPDYGEFGIEILTDEQFKDLFNDASPETRACVAPDDAKAATIDPPAA